LLFSQFVFNAGLQFENPVNKMKNFINDKDSLKSEPSQNSEVPSPELPDSYRDRETVRVAFKMKLFPGFEAEYKKRHDEIWPELVQLLKEAGISEYSIFLDEESNSLFGVLKITNPQNMDSLPQQEVMKRWWKYMGEIMESNADNSPVSVPLKEVFYLP
jgi:L-rhamnose mutarotase